MISGVTGLCYPLVDPFGVKVNKASHLRSKLENEIKYEQSSNECIVCARRVNIWYHIHSLFPKTQQPRYALNRNRIQIQL